jgi:hypothetical protein
LQPAPAEGQGFFQPAFFLAGFFYLLVLLNYVTKLPKAASKQPDVSQWSPG